MVIHLLKYSPCDKWAIYLLVCKWPLHKIVAKRKGLVKRVPVYLCRPSSLFSFVMIWIFWINKFKVARKHFPQTVHLELLDIIMIMLAWRWGVIEGREQVDLEIEDSEVIDNRITEKLDSGLETIGIRFTSK